MQIQSYLGFIGSDESFYARDGGETPQAAAPAAASPPPPQAVAPGASSPPPPQVAAPGAASPPTGSNTDNNSAGFVTESSPQKFETFDEFDPRGAFTGTEFSTLAISSISSLLDLWNFLSFLPFKLLCWIEINFHC